MEASIAAKTNKTDLPSVFRTVGTIAGAAANPFAFAATTIANLIRDIPRLKNPDQSYTKRALPSPDQEAKAANNIYAYEKAIDISVPGQQAEIPSISNFQPGLKTASKDLIGELSIVSLLLSVPKFHKVKAFADAALSEQKAIG